MKLVISRTMAAAFPNVITISGGTAVAAEWPVDANITCSVMLDKAVDPGLFVGYKGKRIYLCCTRCKRQFLKYPEKYINLIKTDDYETTQPREDSQSPKR